MDQTESKRLELVPTNIAGEVMQRREESCLNSVLLQFPYFPLGGKKSISLQNAPFNYFIRILYVEPFKRVCAVHAQRRTVCANYFEVLLSDEIVIAIIQQHRHSLFLSFTLLFQTSAYYFAVIAKAAAVSG